MDSGRVDCRVGGKSNFPEPSPVRLERRVRMSRREFLLLRFRTLGMAGAVLISGCASVVPEPIRTAPASDVRIAQVRTDPQKFHGADVRWGGEIVSVKNQRAETIVEVAGRKLEKDGRPRYRETSEGRFLTRVSGFLDPVVFAAGREITVRGRIEDVVEQPIGEFPYRYPMVRAEHVYLWEPLPPPRAYDPYWWDPWYPWGWPRYRHWPP